jgi:hypothetical protein
VIGAEDSVNGAESSVNASEGSVIGSEGDVIASETSVNGVLGEAAAVFASVFEVFFRQIRRKPAPGERADLFRVSRCAILPRRRPDQEL